MNGSARTTQRHRLNVSDVPFRLIGNILGSPAIEHRRNARRALSLLLAEHLLDVLGLSQ